MSPNQPGVGVEPSGRSETSSGGAALASRSISISGLPRLGVRSSEFRDGEALPTRSTADGDGAPPPLCWDDPQTPVCSFAVICEDPDAPRDKPFVHWLVYGIPENTRSLDANVVGFREGLNGRGDTGFAPAAPPVGQGRHHYHFQVFALDSDVSLPPFATREQLLGAIYQHVVAWGEIVGTYERY